MFGKRKIKTPKFIKKIIKFDKFSKNLDVDTASDVQEDCVATMSYNLITANNKLETGYGISALYLPVAENATRQRYIPHTQGQDIIKVWQYRYYNNFVNRREHRLMWYNANGTIGTIILHSYDTNCYLLDDIPPFTSEPEITNYCYDGQDCILFSYDNGMITYGSGVATQYTTTCKKLYSICNVYEKIFAIVNADKNSIAYSSNLNVTTWQGTETEIDLTGERGSLCALINFNDYLYVFREYGITKLSQYGTSDEFSIEDLFSSSVKIYGSTVVKCGDLVYFMAQDGIYTFNGTTTKKLPIKIQKFLGKINNYNAVACFNNGCYYVACKMYFQDGKQIGCENNFNCVNNALFIINTTTGDYTITRGVDIKSLVSIQDGMVNNVLVSFNNEHSTRIGIIEKSPFVIGENVNAEWCSKKMNFGKPFENKILNTISLNSAYDCTLKIVTENEEKTISVTRNTKTQVFSVKLAAKQFQIKFLSTDYVDISNVEMEVLFYDKK